MPYDPRKAGQKQVRRAQEAAQDYVDGVNTTTINPMAKAKTKKDKLKANFNAAVDNGSWEAGLDSVSFDEWKAITASKGNERYASGVEKAAADIVAFHEELAPQIARVKAMVDAMPDTTLDQRIAKASAFAREMAKFKRTRRRR